MADSRALRQTLNQLDQSSYKTYKSIKGRYAFPRFTLIIDRVQGDPFAAPSQCRVQVPQAEAGFPADTYATPSRTIALRDYLTRQFHRATQGEHHRRGSGKSGLIAIAPPSQHILPRTTAFVDQRQVELRFVVGLPAFGRRIAGRQAAEMLCDQLPRLVEASLFYDVLDPAQLQTHLDTAEDADWLREQLPSRKLVAFIADNAHLPRRSGVDDRPLREQLVPFQSPERLRVKFDCPHRGPITGLGIPAGITLIVGGGYHGKSTLLQAIERGIYNQVPGDGREFVVTHPDAVKVRAEDGRAITGVDLSPFINHLPQGRSTTEFSTQNASGSTSQAAAMVEAVAMGAQVLLVDEDTAATNLMIRDRRMQALIAKAKEPITPLIDKVRQLYTDLGVSSILVMGGSGDYFDVADTVIAMDNYRPDDVTEQAQAIAQKYPTVRTHEGGTTFGQLTPRGLTPDSLGLHFGDRPPKAQVRDLNTMSLDKETLDMSGVEQLVEVGQLRAIAAAMLYLGEYGIDEPQPFRNVVDGLIADLEAHGFDILSRIPEGNWSAFRPFELAAALNRWRRLQVK